MERVPVREWQLIQEPAALRLLLARPDASVQDARVAADIREELDKAGVREVPVHVERVDKVPRTSAGKAPLIRAYQAPHSRAETKGGEAVPELSVGSPIARGRGCNRALNSVRRDGFDYFQHRTVTGARRRLFGRRNGVCCATTRARENLGVEGLDSDVWFPLRFRLVFCSSRRGLWGHRRLRNAGSRRQQYGIDGREPRIWWSGSRPIERSGRHGYRRKHVRRSPGRNHRWWIEACGVRRRIRRMSGVLHMRLSVRCVRTRGGIMWARRSLQRPHGLREGCALHEPRLLQSARDVQVDCRRARRAAERLGRSRRVRLGLRDCSALRSL